MVPGGEDIQAQAEQLLGDGRRHAEASRGILCVGDGDIDALRGFDIRQMIRNDAPADGRKYIANEKNVHTWRPGEARTNSQTLEVTAPSDAEDTSAQYFANTPLV